MAKAVAPPKFEDDYAAQQPDEVQPVPAVAALGENKILKLHEDAGNRAVTSILPKPKLVQRQAEEEEEEEPFETGGMTRQGRMQGHGNTGSPRMPMNHIQRQGGGGGAVRATSTFSSNNPRITRAPAADIGRAHGQPNAAGWTTPRFNFQVPFADPSRIHFSITMDYDMELASDYSGATLSVLQDHEMGHVNIGKNKGKAHLVDDLKSHFESMAALSPPDIVNARDNAIAVFQNEEGIASEDYDSTDYPRMHQAYLGAQTPLADLEASSPAIAIMAANLRLFNSIIRSVGQTAVAAIARSIISSAMAISTDDRNKLQYNPEFKALVTKAQQNVSDYIDAFQFDFFLMGFNALSDSTMAALQDLRTALASFTWQAPP